MGLKYSSGDSRSIVEALTANLAQGQNVLTRLAGGNQHLVASLGIGELTGKAYGAAGALFEGQVGSSIRGAQQLLDSVQKDLDSYTSADARVSGFDVLDEDQMEVQLRATRAQRDATERLIEVNRVAANVASVVPALGESLQMVNRQLETVVTQLEASIADLQGRLRALRAFDAAISGLFLQGEVGAPDAARNALQSSYRGGGAKQGAFIPAVAGGGPKGLKKSGKRPSLKDILHKYQVRDDPGGMVQWKLSGLSEVIVKLLGMEVPEASITATEAELLDQIGPLDHKEFGDIRQSAFDVANERYSSENQNDDHNDAFRHAYWSAMLTREFGGEWTRDYTTAHEGLPGNQAVREAMDLYNNRVGREIQNEHPFASREELADHVAEAVREGRMVVVAPGGDTLEWSDRVPLGGAGKVPDDADVLPGRDPEELKANPGRGAGS